MQYYQVSKNADPKVIGVTNGIYQIDIYKDELKKNKEFEKFLDFFNYNNKEFWNRQDYIPSLKIPVIKAKPLRKAKITDIMGYTKDITFLDNVYSSKYLNILREFNIGNFTTFEVQIEGITEKYYMIYFETIIFEDIDFKNSVIYTGHKVLNNVKYYSINNYAEYDEFSDLNPLHTFEKICIPKNNLNKDIISIRRAVDNFYSERLIEKLLKENISGLDIIYNNSIQLEFR